MASQPEMVNRNVDAVPAEDSWTSPLLPDHTVVVSSYGEPNTFPSAYLETRTTLSRETKALAKSSVRLSRGRAQRAFDLAHTQAPLVLAFLLQYSMTITALVKRHLSPQSW